MSTDRVPLNKPVAISKSEAIEANKAAKAPAGPMHTSTSFMDSIEYQRFADLFEIDYKDRKDEALFDKLSFLYKWGEKRTGENDRIKIFLSLRELTRGLGFSEKGKTQVKKLYQWTRLDSQRAKIEEEQEAISE